MNNSNTDTAPVSSPAAQKPLPSYYAIIPADVRYHPDLPANAKLLYGELTALCNKEGYCWSSNDYFAELYGVKILSIKRWIAALENAGFVTVLLDRTGTRRRIILGEVTAKKIRDGIKNDTGWYPKRYAPRIKKDTHNTTVNTKGNNKENTKEEAEELPPPPPSMGEPPPAAAARAQDFLSSPPLSQEPKGQEPKGPEQKETEQKAPEPVAAPWADLPGERQQPFVEAALAEMRGNMRETPWDAGHSVIRTRARNLYHLAVKRGERP